ncbi:DUF2303 family protein [Nocardia sp. NPDC005745]|uniref:DUF2303 family protein n=1 Tax=Nocardia sp. NPDC005745 TaxID=3157061 RepID=UPI0033E613D1
MNLEPVELSATGDAAAIAEIARESERFGQKIVPEPDALHVNIVRSGEQLDVRSHEAYLYEPSRRRGHSTVTEPGSFTTLLGQDDHHGATIFADETTNRLTAVINFDGWRDHRITLQLTHSDQFLRWSQRSGKFYNQVDFAELLEDFAADIHDPTAADMIELAQSFQAARQVSFESSSRLSNGAVSFRYREDIDAKAGNAGQLEVPETFVLQIPILRGGDHVQVIAKLRYRIEHNSLKLGFRVPGLDDLRLQAFATATSDVITELDTAHGHTVVYGPAPAPIDPLP